MITKTLKTAAGVTFAAMLLGATAVSAKTLVYCSEGSPENFTPAINTTGTSFDAARPVYDKLVAFKRGTTEVEPSLAESWDVADGGKTITFKLRKGVKFHSGVNGFKMTCSGHSTANGKKIILTRRSLAANMIISTTWICQPCSSHLRRKMTTPSS
jgi:ABC-type transport system substrate-binding protein